MASKSGFSAEREGARSNLSRKEAGRLSAHETPAEDCLADFESNNSTREDYYPRSEERIVVCFSPKLTIVIFYEQVKNLNCKWR